MERKYRQQLAYSLTTVLCLCAISDCLASNWQPQVDLQGDAHYSRYNFTDIKSPYDGIDGWLELKLALWDIDAKDINARPDLSPYVSLIPVTTTESEFWWQRNFTSAFGLQLYPVDTFLPEQKNNIEWLRGLRIYTTYGFRGYYDKPSHESPQDEDFRFGFDYYGDNFYKTSMFTYLLWTNLTYRSTNYSISDYSAVLWEGNLKIGHKFDLNPNSSSKSFLLPYGLIDWTYVPAHSDRWWENFVRAGAGISFYPFVLGGDKDKNVLNRVLDRFNIYAEVLHNASWLGDNAPDKVHETDWRIGINFSTFWDWNGQKMQ